MESKEEQAKSQKCEPGSQLTFGRQWNGISKRYILTMVLFFGVMNYYVTRLNISMAIVSMVSSKAEVGNITTEQTCVKNTDVNITVENVIGGEFEWTPQEQGHILGGFYYGYMASQVPGGVLAQRYGGRKCGGIAFLVIGALTLLTPVAARLHIYVLVALRILMGLAAGAGYPGIHSLLVKWAPSKEKSRMSGLVFAGAHLGTVVSQISSGLLGSLFGWISVFYVTGSASVLLSVTLVVVLRDTPAKHPTISAREKQYIEKTVLPSPKKLKNPWGAMLTSMPFWALLVSRVCSLWSMFTMMSYLPRYMEQILHFNMKENGFISALPYLVSWLFIVVGGFVSDFLHHKGISMCHVRKLMNTLGHLLPAAMMVAINNTGCDVIIKVIFLVLAVGFSGLAYSGYYSNHFDIAPKFAAVIFGIANTVASFTGFVSPYLIGYIMSEKQTQAEWRLVFYICVGIYVFGALFFLIFADGKPQSWAGEHGVKDLEIAAVSVATVTATTDKKILSLIPDTRAEKPSRYVPYV